MTFDVDQKIVLASNNAGKIAEIQAILAHYPIIPQARFAIDEVEETGSTFIENAIIKARHAAQASRLPALADDSGLVVDVLDGAPGVISARYAGVGSNDRQNLDKLLQALEGIPEQQRTARFICVIVLMRHANDPFPLITQGVWEGLILEQARGENGFGYDPVFWVPEFQCASAELSPELKNSVSHRGQALRQLAELVMQQVSI